MAPGPAYAVLVDPVEAHEGGRQLHRVEGVERPRLQPVLQLKGLPGKRSLYHSPIRELQLQI